MHTRFAFAMLTVAAVLAVACSDDGTKEQSPGEVLAHDSMLASELKQADTSAFAEAADVAMAFDPDSATPPATSATRRSPTTKATPAAPSTAVPKRDDRPGAPPATSAPTPPSRAPMRPVPATIHPDPIPTRTLPVAPAARTNSATVGTAASSSAAAILERVPGASLPPAGATRRARRPRRSTSGAA